MGNISGRQRHGRADVVLAASVKAGNLCLKALPIFSIGSV
jgi:hypothetical protein